MQVRRLVTNHSGKWMKPWRDKLNGKWFLKGDLLPPRRDSPRKLQKRIIPFQPFAEAKRFNTSMDLRQQRKRLPFLPQALAQLKYPTDFLLSLQYFQLQLTVQGNENTSFVAWLAVKSLMFYVNQLLTRKAFKSLKTSSLHVHYCGELPVLQKNGKILWVQKEMKSFHQHSVTTTSPSKH